MPSSISQAQGQLRTQQHSKGVATNEHASGFGRTKDVLEEREKLSEMEELVERVREHVELCFNTKSDHACMCLITTPSMS